MDLTTDGVGGLCEYKDSATGGFGALVDGDVLYSGHNELILTLGAAGADGSDIAGSKVVSLIEVELPYRGIRAQVGTALRPVYADIPELAPEKGFGRTVCSRREECEHTVGARRAHRGLFKHRLRPRKWHGKHLLSDASRCLPMVRRGQSKHAPRILGRRLDGLSPSPTTPRPVTVGVDVSYHR